jgi:DNA-binding FrmR family transcriptional regulator
MTTTPGHAGDHGAGDTFRHSYSRDKAQLVRRLARIEGQVRGIARMIEREEYCVDILQQTSALRAAVDSLAILVLEDHVRRVRMPRARRRGTLRRGSWRRPADARPARPGRHAADPPYPPRVGNPRDGG